MQKNSLYAGIGEIKTQITDYTFEQGIEYKNIYAHLISPIMIAFKPALPGKHHPAPWKTVLGGFEKDIVGELMIDKALEDKYKEIDKLAYIIIFLFKLGIDPEIRYSILSTDEIQGISLTDDSRTTILPMEVGIRYFELNTEHNECTIDSFDWVKERYKKTYELYVANEDFALAVDSINNCQFQKNTALTMLSIWASLESLFSPSMTELKFRISALIASYLENPGEQRYALQKEMLKLYDKRSAAAHGKPKHSNDDLLRSISLLREVLFKIIDNGVVPTKEELEKKLFG